MKPNFWIVILGIIMVMLVILAGGPPPTKDSPALHGQSSVPGQLSQPAPAKVPSRDDQPLATDPAK